ncbi:MAG TPA: hypothetical protein V6C52_15160 [Coleofasciculaceae cyanobacterium]|jgi:hypothetical protein
MSEAQSIILPVATPPEGGSLGTILKNSFVLYRGHFGPFTRVLLVPVGLMMVGAYACIGLSHLYINRIEQAMGGLNVGNIGFFLLGLLLVMLGPLLLLKKGVLDYAIYMASLCSNTAEVLNGKKPDFEGAYAAIAKEKFKPYMALLTAYLVIPLLAFLPFIMGSILAGLIQAEGLPALIFGMGLLLSLGAGIICTVCLILLSFIFQIVAFEKLTLNPLPAFLESSRMVFQAPFRTLSLQIILMILTGTLLPFPLAGLLRLLRLTFVLDFLHRGFVDSLLLNIAPESGWGDVLPYYDWIYGFLRNNTPAIAASLTDTLVMAIITSLLLPLGTFAFTLLYWDIQSRLKNKLSGN